MSVWVAHDATFLGLLGFESADGGMKYADPDLTVFKGVRMKLKHSVDYHQVKTILLVILWWVGGGGGGGGDGGMEGEGKKQFNNRSKVKTALNF